MRSYSVWQWPRTVVYVPLHDCVNVRVCSVYLDNGVMSTPKRRFNLLSLTFIVLCFSLVFYILGSILIKQLFHSRYLDMK